MGILVACQRDGCAVKFWRSIKCGGRAGQSYFKRMFCSKKCNLDQLHAESSKKTEVPCSWCKKIILRKPSKILENAFCRPDHYFLFQRKSAHDKKEAERVEREGTDGRSLMECEKCRDVTDHVALSASSSKCVPCGTVRDSRVKISA